MTNEMYAAIGDAEHDANVRCVIVTGNGRAFTSGHDLGELADASAPPVRSRTARSVSTVASSAASR